MLDPLPVEDPQYGAMTEAAESLLAQIDLQRKLSTPRQENRIIPLENEI
jgi:hypothetical protein